MYLLAEQELLLMTDNLRLYLLQMGTICLLYCLPDVCSNFTILAHFSVGMHNFLRCAHQVHAFEGLDVSHCGMH
jgi:hypothetical protein